MTTETWKTYFDFSPLDRNRTNGFCRLCKQNYKDRVGISSNFLKHLRRVHATEYGRIFDSDKECTTGEKTIAGDDRTPTDSSLRKSKQNRIVLSIAKNLITRCNLPLSLVENPGFRDFMKESNFKCDPISAKKLKRDVIPVFETEILKTIHDKLNNIDHLTLTIDGWSDRRCRSFLGITCHFIDNKMMPQAYLIDFLRFKSPHTAENIQLTEDVLERFNIKEKVFKIITDNASAMIKAYKFGLFNDVDNDDVYDDLSYSIPEVDPLSEHDQFVEFNDFQMINLDYGDDADSEGSPQIRLSCFAHTMQLCIRDGLKNASYMARVLGKCKVLGKFSHKSSKAADLLDSINKNINKMNITRWNSEYLLVKSILALEKKDLEDICQLMEDPVKFSNNDLVILEEILDVLEPFYEISVKCQADMIVTASMVVPAIVHLISHLRDVKEHLQYCNKLVQHLELFIEKRFTGIVNRLNQVGVDDNDPFNDPVYFMAAALDPSFKLYWIRDLKLPSNTENRLKQNMIQLILDEISKDLSKPLSRPSDHNTTLATTTTTSFSSGTPKVKRRKLFNYSDNHEDLNDSTAMKPASELENYLNDSTKVRFSDYWVQSRLNLLKRLVSRVFSVQASSAPVERVFSQAGLILTSRRANMNEQLFKHLVFLGVNQSLL